MTNQLFFDGVATLVLPNVLIHEVKNCSEVGFPYVVYGSDNRKFYFSYSTIIPN